MKKLLAVISSIAVCVSAVAVSVLSYFPSPAKVGASAPDTSNLVTTSLDLDDTASYPTITFTAAGIYNATSNQDVWVNFSPSGWQSLSSRCSPSSYGVYDASKGRIDILIRWEVANRRFVVYGYSNFPALSSSREVFSYLQIRSVSSNHFLSRLSFARDWSLMNTATSYQMFYYFGESYDHTAFEDPHTFDFVGVIGNFYDLYVSSTAYVNGYSEGSSVGYSNGYSEGSSVGYSNGLNDGTRNFGMWDLFSNAFGSVGNILGIQLFPGLSIGLLISVPIAFAFILWLIHVLKG